MIARLRREREDIDEGSDELASERRLEDRTERDDGCGEGGADDASMEEDDRSSDDPPEDALDEPGPHDVSALPAR